MEFDKTEMNFRWLTSKWRVIVVVGYTLAALSFSLPSEQFPLKPAIGMLTSRVMTTLSLWQYWDMFAPTPRTDDIKFEVIYRTADGRQKAVFLTDMVSMGYFERWQKERWRKFFNDHLRTDAESYLWQPFTEFYYRDLVKRGELPTKIELVRYWRSSERPVHPSLRSGVRETPWRRHIFYSWNSPVGGVQNSAPDREGVAK